MSSCRFMRWFTSVYASGAWVVGFALTFGMATRASAKLWDKVEFGMPLARFLEAYPAAEPANPAAENKDSPFVSYRLDGQSVGPLKECQLEFSFTGAERVLYRFQAHCSSDPQDIHRYLTARYGNPTRVSKQMLVWTNKDIEVTLTPKSGVFTISDVERSQSVAATLMRMLGRVPIGPTQPPASDDRTPEPPLSDRPQ